MVRDDADDREWPDPPGVGDGSRRQPRDVHRLGVRLACSALVALVLLLVFSDYVTGFLLTAIWPPQNPLSRWATLVLLQVGGFLILPLMVGGLVGDVVYDRFF
ncbi:hypothetical protein [Haloarchaeobius sp. HRN-SO-5]|uniref:hypothetical protein n=1 Tax=Haloarchaeobius sp. HRN-SO-5 TaxID=3446118 RepID=UPI003EBD257A